MKNCDFFLILLKTLIVGTRENRLFEAVLTSTHNLCFRAKIRKNVYPCKPQFYYIKVGCKGVYITRTCYPDDQPKNYAAKKKKNNRPKKGSGQNHFRPKKWSGHGRTGRTADDGLVNSATLNTWIRSSVGVLKLLFRHLTSKETKTRNHGCEH